MTIQIVFHNEGEEDHELVIDRNHQEGHVTVTIDDYGKRNQIKVPSDEFQKMIDLAGFGA